MLAIVGIAVVVIVVSGWYMSRDTTGPIVSSTVPANAATDVAISGKIYAIFSEAMDPLTIKPATFTVTGPSGTPVVGTLDYADVTAVFTPASDLVPNTEYSCVITAGAKDLAGNQLASDYEWTFRTA